METSESPGSWLLCGETVHSLDDKEEMAELHLENACDEEYIEMIIDIENPSALFQELMRGSWIQQARLDGINYILRKRELLGFKCQTAYVSVTYLDRFLSERSINEEKFWAVRLLSMACLSLAAKMEETTVPPLSGFCLGEYSFENRMIQRMELLVLNTLDWKLGAVTPFHFIHFFAKKFFDSTPQKVAVSRIVEIILSSMRDARFVKQRPSVIAATATLFTVDQGLSREALQQKIDPFSGSLKVEEIISCYFQFEEMNKESLKRSIGSPDLSPLQLVRADPSGGSSLTSAATRSKRRRLVFNGNDQDRDASEKGETDEATD